MRTIKILVSMLPVLLAVGVVTATAGAHQWKLNGEPIEKTSIGTTGTATMEFEFRGGRISCKFTTAGKVGPGAKGEITSISGKSCESLEDCKGLPTAQALNLPWVTELMTVEGRLRDVIKGHALGRSGLGWSVYCSSGSEGEKLECFGETNTAMYKYESDVEAVFDGHSPALNNSCFGGLIVNGPLYLTGSETIAATHGGTLSVE